MYRVCKFHCDVIVMSRIYGRVHCHYHHLVVRYVLTSWPGEPVGQFKSMGVIIPIMSLCEGVIIPIMSLSKGVIIPIMALSE